MSLDSGLLTITGVTKVFDSPSQSASPGVLRGVNLTLAAGESVAIIGPSGSGKSTLLNLIGTLDRPSSGQIVLHGKDLAALQENDLAEVRNRQIGFIFQLHHCLLLQ